MSSKLVPSVHPCPTVHETALRSQVAVHHPQQLRHATAIVDSLVSRVTSVEVREESDGPAVRVLVDRRIGRYELVRRCRPDGIGSVWQAHFDGKEHQVLLRIVRHNAWKDANEQDQWLLSAMRCARLRHPGIVPIREVACLKKHTMIASDWIPGESLATAIEQGTFDTRGAVALIATVSEALQYVHSRGAFHGDLTPGRITLQSGTKPIVNGFGAADLCSVSWATGRSARKQLAYASPERVKGGAWLDGRTDVYSVGAILYELLTGEVPFRGVPDVIIRRVIHESPTAPRRLRPAIPKELEAIVLRCLAKQPSARYSAAELASELNRWLERDGESNRLENSIPSRRRMTLLPMLAIPAASLLCWPVMTWLGPTIFRTTILSEPEAVITFADMATLACHIQVASSSQASQDEARQTSYVLPRLVEREELESDCLPTDRVESPMVFRQGDVALPSLPDEVAAQVFHAARNARRSDTPANALEANRTARAALESILRDHPSSIDARGYLAAICLDAVRLQRGMGLSAESKSSLEAVRSLIRDCPEQDMSVEQRRRLAASYFELAELQVQVGRDESAIEDYQRSLAIRMALANELPDNARLQEDLVESHCSLALFFAPLHRTAESRELLARARRSLNELEAGSSATPNQFCDWGRFWNNIGCTEFALGDHRAARDSFERARHLFEQAAGGDALATKTGGAMTLQLVAQCYENSGIAQKAVGDSVAGKQSLSRAAEIRAQLKPQ